MTDSIIRLTPRIGAPTVSPYLYSSFAEHFGRCIDDGIWVGQGSDIPHEDGLRRDTLEALAELALPSVRWPGGNWAEYYHWRDGIGPPHQRPLRYNIEWGIPENNAFGTHEYMRFCQAIGAEPYLVLNVASGTVQEGRDWVEYCNADHDSEIVRLRRANGQEQPWRVRLWDIGNESWHSGGQFRSQDYVAAYRRHSNKLRMLGTGDRDKASAVKLIACGACLLYRDWDADFLAGMQQTPNMLHMVDYISDHIYQGRDLTDRDFPDEDHYHLLSELDILATELRRAANLVGAYSTNRHPIGLALGEWGTWYKGVWITNRFHQANTLRDALFTATGFHLLHSFADTLYMANMSMTVNALQCLVHTYGPLAVKTPTYHVFRMYKPHRNGILLDCELAGAPQLRFPDGSTRPALSLSATASQDGLFVTVVNNDLSTDFDAHLLLPHAFTPSGISAERLTAPDIRVENTANDPDAVSPTPLHAAISEADKCRLTFPAKSVTAVQFQGRWAYAIESSSTQASLADLDRQMQEQSEFEVKV